MTKTLDAPVIPTRSVSSGHSSDPAREADLRQWQCDRDAFRAMLPHLLASYPGKFVAVYKGKVVGVGDEILATARDARRRCGGASVYVDEAAEQRRVERLPSARLPREGEAG